MPPPQSIPTSRQVAPTWVAQLDSELQRASIPDRSIEAFEFPNILIQTLLSSDTSLDAEEIDCVVSIITKDLESVTSVLKPLSLRTLAALLLRLHSQHAQNIGLDLLVRASRVANSGSKSPGSYFAKSDKVLVDQELGRCLYHLFNNGDQEVPSRRLAGKLFLAVTANVQVNTDAFLSPSQAELSRTTHILTHGTDKILKFLASTILTGFWRSGINIPDIPQTERKFLENVNASPGDIIENFYHHEQTKKDQQTNQATQACNLLQSLHIDGNTLVIGPIAALLSANALTLLYAVDATAGRCFDYLEIPLGAILEVSPLTIESMSTLVLTLDSSVMTVNGPDDVLQGQKLRLTSKESLKDLETAIHAAAESRRCGVREGILVTRKASSTLISLDLRDEIVRKSAGPNDIGRDMDPDHESHTVANGQSAGHVAFVSGTTCNEAVVQGDQSQTVSANAITIVHQDNVPGNSEVGSSPSRGHQEQSQRPMGQAKAMCTEDQIESLSETEGKPDAQKVQNADAFQINRVPENVIEKSDQNVRRNLPYQLRSLSSKTKPPARFTNTQESLMFHRRKPGQKVYTSHSKAAVDWDEDLRQSSDNLDGTVEKETITSISSPFPGDGSIFDRRTSTAKRKRDPVGKASSKKKRKTNPRPRKKDVGTTAPGDEQSRASRQDKAEREADDAEWSSADDAQTGHSGSKSEENHDPLTNHDQRHIERGGLNTAQYTLTTLKATDAHNMTELIKDSTGSDKGADIAVEENVGVGNATDKTSHEEHKDSLATNEYGPGGRGKAVGRKLTAAFKDFDTQGNEGSFEQRVCDEAAHSIPLSAPDEGVESVHSTELSRIHQYSTQRLEPTIPRSPCWNTMVSQSPRSSMRTESNELDNPAQSTVFFDPTHIEMSRIGGSRPRSEVKQWKISISAGGKSRNTTSEEDGRRDLKDAARRRSLPRDLRRIPAPILQSSSTPKRMMVDKNGSPQMIRRGATACTTLQESSIQSKVGMRMKPVQLVFQGQGKGNESGYDGGSETDATEEAPERDGHVSSSPLCYHSPAHPLLERAAAPAGTLEGLDIDQVVQTDSKSTCELLETAHKRTQSMLLASSQRLACQLEDEKKAVNQVLEVYQRQCHQVLDELFKTQEERIRLCEQQAESIRTHHARICQGLINRLEANGRMAHKRTLPDLPASQKDAAMDHD